MSKQHLVISFFILVFLTSCTGTSKLDATVQAQNTRIANLENQSNAIQETTNPTSNSPVAGQSAKATITVESIQTAIKDSKALQYRFKLDDTWMGYIWSLYPNENGETKPEYRKVTAGVMFQNQSTIPAYFYQRMIPPAKVVGQDGITLSDCKMDLGSEFRNWNPEAPHEAVPPQFPVVVYYDCLIPQTMNDVLMVITRNDLEQEVGIGSFPIPNQSEMGCDGKPGCLQFAENIVDPTKLDFPELGDTVHIDGWGAITYQDRSYEKSKQLWTFTIKIKNEGSTYIDSEKLLEIIKTPRTGYYYVWDEDFVESVPENIYPDSESTWKFAWQDLERPNEMYLGVIPDSQNYVVFKLY